MSYGDSKAASYDGPAEGPMRDVEVRRSGKPMAAWKARADRIQRGLETLDNGIDTMHSRIDPVLRPAALLSVAAQLRHLEQPTR